MHGQNLSVAYVTTDLLGNVNRFVPVGRELQERGIAVTVVSAFSRTIEVARESGFDTALLAEEEILREALPVVEEWTGASATILRRIPGVGLGPRASAIAHWTAHHQMVSDTGELAATLQHVNPSLVLTEAEQHREIRIAANQGWPVLLLEDFYSVRPGPDVTFPSGNHQIPTGDARSRLQARLRWERFFVMEWVRRRAESLWVEGHDWSSGIEDLPAPDTLGPIERRYVQRYDYPKLPRIRMIAPELALPGEPLLPVVVGAVIDPDRTASGVDADFASRWATILDQKNSGTRIIYVTIGTFLSGLEDLMVSILGACARLDGAFTVVVAAGNDADMWVKRSDPFLDGVEIFRYVPQLDVLAEAALVVTTGGLNTTHEAVWFETPMLNVPVEGIDTAGNAARMAFHGVGEVAVGKDLAPSTLAVKMQRLLDDEDVASRLKHLSGVMRDANSIVRSADVIKDTLVQVPRP